ncbi:Protein kinase C-like phorbol ester/diacylglycerol-binding domain [Arabidopsis suecica]|uniref:Protein kinase C-like phorbol ester/diacylglycerol-binding domain n=1 Tax=Arabidopsis suecica TaxID=45249 RepID=A0A8T2AJY7_ARASU|nr:Protein kinase C-like phorbol ester/diacylglycerol-binding domain [Arabidopsis suecica]
MEYKHFSHPHTLKLQQIQTHGSSDSLVICSGCESAICDSETAYICSTCDFNLHEQCGNAVRGMQHPSHAGLHHLTLVPYTTYSAGTFLCRACGCTGGKGFSYCCPLCDFDLHVQCAHLPQVTVHESHPLHSLLLVYNSTPAMSFTQFGFGNQLVCNLCNMAMDGRFWSYNCYACNYHIHASCAVNKPKPVAASAENCGTSDEGKTPNAESVPVQGLETAQTEQVAATTEQVEDPALRQQLELQKLQLELDMSSALANMIGSFNLSSFV